MVVPDWELQWLVIAIWKRRIFTYTFSKLILLLPMDVQKCYLFEENVFEFCANTLNWLFVNQFQVCLHTELLTEARQNSDICLKKMYLNFVPTHWTDYLWISFKYVYILNSWPRQGKTVIFVWRKCIWILCQHIELIICESVSSTSTYWTLDRGKAKQWYLFEENVFEFCANTLNWLFVNQFQVRLHTELLTEANQFNVLAQNSNTFSSNK